MCRDRERLICTLFTQFLTGNWCTSHHITITFTTFLQFQTTKRMISCQYSYRQIQYQFQFKIQTWIKVFNCLDGDERCYTNANSSNVQCLSLYIGMPFPVESRRMNSDIFFSQTIQIHFLDHHRLPTPIIQLSNTNCLRKLILLLKEMVS